MAYAPPSLGSAGLTIPTYNDILNDLIAQYRNIYGQTAYLDIDSADYQWISVVAAKIADTHQALLLAYNARSPLTAIGGSLDSIVKINGLARKAASASTCGVTLTGTVGATISNGVVKDTAGYLWSLPPSVQISGTGSITVTATCQTLGRIAPAIGDLSQIATPQAGWVSVTNATSASVGQPVESDAQLRARQSLSVATPSRTMISGTVAAIAATAGVSRYNIIENPTNATDANSTPAHSITCVVEGGDDTAVAQSIYNNRGIGCYTNGATTINVTDPYTNAVMPIRFSRPTYVPVYVTVSVHTLGNYTTATSNAIIGAVATYLNSLQIGQTVVMSELFAAALSARPDPTNPLFSVRGVNLGTAASPSGTADLTMTYAQVAQGINGNMIVSFV